MVLADILNKERPKVISTTGYIFCVIAILMIVVSILALVANLIASKQVGNINFPGPMNFLFKHYTYFAASEFLIGGFLLLLSANFLLLRNWARVGLQVFLFMALIATIFFCKLWIGSLKVMMPNENFKMIGILIGSGVEVFWSAICITVIIFLKSKKIKQYFVMR